METTNTRKSKKPLLIAICCFVAAAILCGILLLLTQCDGTGDGPAVNSGKLAQQLAAEGKQTITINEDIIVDAPLVVNGEKTLEGSGRILLKTELEGTWPESDKPSWGMGCADLEAEDASGLPAVLQLSQGASLTLSGSVTVDAEGNANGILLGAKASITVSDSAVIKNGRYANLVIPADGQATIAGGEVLDGNAYNIINDGKLDVTGGTVSGAKTGANIYTAGTATQSGGSILLSGLHNVYVAEGSFTMTGGCNNGAAKDGIVVAEGAGADVTGGEISNCIHGLCNNGTMTTGKVQLSECGIMNYKTGKLDILDTTVDTSEVYCLANNGGTVNAQGFTAKNCDTCAVYNFSGDMNLKDLTVSGSRDGNISNAGGNLTVDGAVLESCRDKSVVVGSGKAVLNNVTIGGTSNEKYGVYIFGGELYINDSTIENVSSTAVKADAGSYVELNNVAIKEVSQNGFQVDGGRIVANNVSMENLGSHGIYNNGGEVIADGLTITGVKKNAVQHKSGTTTVSGVTAKDMGNHGAYVESGTLTVKDSAFADMNANGFYIVKGDNKLVLEGVSITGTVQQGINNESTVEVKNVTISNTGKNGIYNKVGGKMTIDGLTVKNAAEHGVNNKAQMTASNVTISGTGKDSNGIQNNGTLTLSGVSISSSKNHGIYNAGKLTAQNVTINGTADNGVYNDKGEATITTLTVANTTGQGVNNNSTITLKDVKISATGKNGVYNSDGTATIEDLTVDGTAEHGVNNAAAMTLTGAAISNTGEGKNGVQNSGTLNAAKLTVSASKNHGIYNAGKLTAEDVTISGTGDNGVYNDKGQAAITKLSVDTTGGQGVNNNSTITLKNVKISATGKNGVYNSDGTATIEDLTVSATTEHGVNNVATMTLTGAVVSGTGTDKNGIQNTGTLTVSNVKVSESKKHGIYNAGKLSGADVTISGTGDNGIYNDRGTVDVLKNVTISGTATQGINSNSSFAAVNVTISGTKKNGVYITGGTAVLTDLKVTDPGEHGISNSGGTVTLVDSVFTGSGLGKNGIQNQGTMTTENVTVKDSSNHGIYNDSQFTALGELTVSGATVNGIYNYNGTVNLAKATVTATGSHGINNAGTLEAQALVISKTTENGIQNSGEMTVTGTAEITDSGKHGIYNGKIFRTSEDAVINITNAVDLLLNNGGDMIAYGLNLSGTAHKAVYNSGYAELYKMTVDGTQVRNPSTVTLKDEDNNEYTVTVYSAEYLIDNNGGVLDLTDTVITNAFGTAIHNRGKSAVSVTNVTIDTVGNYAIFVEGNAKLSGDTLYISHVKKNATVENAEGMALKIQGKASMLDHVFIDDVASNNAIVIDAATAGYSGLGLTVTNVPNGCAVYNKGTVYVTDFEAQNVKDGMVSRYTGNATLSGTVTMKDIIRNPITTYGPESGGYSNSVSLTSGTVMTVENCGSHAINNKGAFLAAADSKIVIKNVEGQNVNAINNNGGTMTLGDVEIDGVFVTITSNKDTDKINTNSGTAIMNSGPMEMNGDVVIKNVFYLTLDKNGDPVNNRDDNTNGAGLVVRKSGSSITGTGSITVIGNQTAPEGYEGYEGMHNGIFVDGRTIDIEGNVSVSNVKNQGIYLANGNAKLECGDVTVTGVTGNGIYMNNTSGVLNAKKIVVDDVDNYGLQIYGTANVDSIQITNVAGSARHGLYLRGQAAKVTVKGDVTVQNVTGRGIVVEATVILKTDNNQSYRRSVLTVGGNILVENTAQDGIWLQGQIDVTGTMTIKNAAGNGIAMNATDIVKQSDNTKTGTKNVSVINATGLVTIDTTGNHGINKNSGGQLTAGGLTIKNVQGAYNGISNGGGGKVIVNGNLLVDGVSGGDGVTDDNRGNGLFFNNGALTVTGDLTVKNISANATKKGTDANVVNNGIYNAGAEIKVGGNLTVSNVSNNHGIHNKKTIQVTGDVSVSGIPASVQGIYMNGGSAVITAANMTISNVGNNSNGIYINNAAGKIELTGDLTIKDVGKHGVSTKGTVKAKNILITYTDVEGVTGEKSALKDGINLADYTGKVEAQSITVNNAGQYGIGGKGGSVIANSIYIDGSAANGINLEGTNSSTLGSLRADLIQVTNTASGKIGIYVKYMAVEGVQENTKVDCVIVNGTPGNHAVQIQQYNAFKVNKLIVANAGKTGLRLWNSESVQPQIQVTEMVAYMCGDYAVSADSKAVTSTDVISIGKLYYAACQSGMSNNVADVCITTSESNVANFPQYALDLFAAASN